MRGRSDHTPSSPSSPWGARRSTEVNVSGRWRFGHIPEPGIPESFKVLMKEMQALCLDVEVISHEGKQVELTDLDEEVFTAVRELGIDISRNERGSDADDRERERRREKAF